MVKEGNGKTTSIRTAVVAGGAGFIGSHLCEKLLREGNRVICVDSYLTSSAKSLEMFHRHRAFRSIEHDLCDPLEIEVPIDEIYNLACAASPQRYQADPVHTMMTSVVGTGNLLELAARHGARLLQASTSEVYGDPAQHPQREDYYGNVNCTGPRACYDEGKRAAEALCFDYLRAGKVDTRVARIFNTYGPRMQPDDGRIVSNLIVQALNGQDLTIYGTGKQTRSFCYVSDMVEGLWALMSVSPNSAMPVNLGNPAEFTINDLAQIVRDLTRTKSKIVYRPLPQDDPQRRQPDISRAKKLLGWQPTVSLREGLSRTVDWFADHLRLQPTYSKRSSRQATRRVSPRPGIAAGTVHG